jgi:capsular exopolysaccharide synthesis family protein
MPATEGSSDLDLRHYLRVLRRRKWVVLLTVGAVLILAMTLSLLQTPVYKATADLLITPSTIDTSSLFNSPSAVPADPTRNIQTQIQIIASRPVQDLVKKQLGKAPPVSASPVGQTDVVAVVGTSTSAIEAADLANAYANAYIDFNRKQIVNSLLSAGDQIQGKINDLQKQIDSLDAQLAAADPKDKPTVEANLSPQRDSLVTQQAQFKQRLDQLQVDASLTTGQARVVTPATRPSSPASPRPARTAALAIAVGLIVGLGVAFLVDYLDDSVRTREDVDRATHGLPDLGLIPRIVTWKDAERPQVVSLDQPMSPAAEAYRTLRTSIQFVGLDHSARIIQVTSANAEEGKSTTLANLAVALASAGERVCMCCCDLRRPRIHEFFGLDNKLGFTSVILGQASLQAAVQTVPGVDRLSLLASGPIPPNPSELLSSNRTAEVVALLAASYDVILLDCSPVLPVTDAAVIAGLAEATVLVVNIGESTRREIGRMIEILQQVDAPIIGTVLNGVSADGSDGYYRHTRYYRATTTEDTGPRRLVGHAAGH